MPDLRQRYIISAWFKAVLFASVHVPSGYAKVFGSLIGVSTLAVAGYRFPLHLLGKVSVLEHVVDV